MGFNREEEAKTKWSHPRPGASGEKGVMAVITGEGRGLETMDVDFFLGFDDTVLEEELSGLVTEVTLELDDFIAVVILEDGTVGRIELSHALEDLVEVEVGSETGNGGQRLAAGTLLGADVDHRGLGGGSLAGCGGTSGGEGI